MFIGLLKAYMKRIDYPSSMQKKLALFDVPFLKNPEKNAVKVVKLCGNILLVKSHFFLQNIS